MTCDFFKAVRQDSLDLKLCYVIEESQNTMPSNSLRGNQYQEINRFVTQGRNFGLSFIAITQRCANVDVNLIELSGLRYFGKTNGENNIRKLKSWLPKEYIEEVKTLSVGKFAIQNSDHLTVEQIPCFESRTTPTQLTQPKKKLGFWSRLFNGEN